MTHSSAFSLIIKICAQISLPTIWTRNRSGKTHLVLKFCGPAVVLSQRACFISGPKTSYYRYLVREISDGLGKDVPFNKTRGNENPRNCFKPGYVSARVHVQMTKRGRRWRPRICPIGLALWVTSSSNSSIDGRRYSSSSNGSGINTNSSGPDGGEKWVFFISLSDTPMVGLVNRLQNTLTCAYWYTAVGDHKRPI